VTGEIRKVATTDTRPGVPAQASGEARSKQIRSGVPRRYRGKSPAHRGDRKPSAAAHIWAAVLVLLLAAVLFFLPNPTAFQQSLTSFLAALTGGVFFVLLRGRFRLEGRIRGLLVSAGGGAGLFILTLSIFNPVKIKTDLIDLVKSQSPAITSSESLPTGRTKDMTARAASAAGPSRLSMTQREDVRGQAQRKSILPRSAREFHIPAGDCSETLDKFAEQADRSVLYDYTALKGVRTQSVEGLMTPEEALRRMLAQTGVSFETVGNHVVAITRIRR
jgi:hypothetical protein